MKNKTLMAASLIALMSAGLVHAEAAHANKDSGVVQDIKSGLNKADASMRETADDIKAFIVGDEKLVAVNFSYNTTANKMIGEDVVSTGDKKVADVKDIIIGTDGTARQIIVSDGGLLGIGDKLAAFDYSRVVTQEKDGTVIMRINQDMVDNAKDFSYDNDVTSRDRIISPKDLSVMKILDGRVVDALGKDVADIDNITFKDGIATHAIVSFDKTLGLGGKKAAFKFDSLAFTKSGDEVNAHLTADQTTEFDQFRNALKE